jgi:hypothetical protein
VHADKEPEPLNLGVPVVNFPRANAILVRAQALLWVRGLFVLRLKKQFLSPSPAVVVISMASASQYDSRRHSNMAQTRPNFFHIDSLTSFC